MEEEQEVDVVEACQEMIELLRINNISPVGLNVILASLVGTFSALDGYSEEELIEMVTTVSVESFRNTNILQAMLR